jgi:steroid delta-isomerase-like uncharacterized protein
MDQIPERARPIIRLVEEVFNDGHLDLIDELIARDAVEHEALPIATGELRTDLRMWLAELRGAFPDYHVEVQDVIVEGDKAVVRERITGTNSGTLMGIPPTGRPICIEAIDIVRIDHGAIVEHWGIADSATMLRQLGLEHG